jgi:hypothetical protein
MFFKDNLCFALISFKIINIFVKTKFEINIVYMATGNILIKDLKKYI